MVPRTQINKKDIKTSFNIKENRIKISPRKLIQSNKRIKRILAYSTKKIKANPPPPYSTLNPETSSDSPSAKSKGVRLVSTKQEINQINDNGREIKINHK
jgi:hypothetical protein